MQLVQLQQAQQRFKEHGIGLAAISYDTEAILKDFSQRHSISFPLLADPQSGIIRQYGVLNAEAKGMNRGMAFPGFFYIDPSGKIKEKFFEAAYTDRYTANNVIARLFPELVEQTQRKIEAPHVELTLQQSDQVGIPGSRVTLIAEMNLGPDLHVYAPGVTGGYKPIELKLDPSSDIKLHPAAFPKPKVLFLEAINEKVPVFEGRFRIVQDITVSADRSFVGSLGKGKNVAIKGELKYQACDKTTCFTPTSVPVSWEVQVLPLDLQRSPEAIQHR
jgi:hypothetical protein